MGSVCCAETHDGGATIISIITQVPSVSQEQDASEVSTVEVRHRSEAAGADPQSQARTLQAVPAARAVEVREAPAAVAAPKVAKPPPAEQSPFTPGKVANYYTVAGASIGEGSFGQVRKAVCKATGEHFAVKEIPIRDSTSKSRAEGTSLESVVQEASVMRGLSHPNVVRLHAMFRGLRSVYLVMDLCEGGDLYDALADSASLKETEAAALMQQILRGVNYIHHQRIAHRDLKPENFLLLKKCTSLLEGVVKMVDFGSAWAFADPDTPMELAAVGSDRYIAPEVLEERYTLRCDLWSCGVIAYVMLYGEFPFISLKETVAAKPKFKKTLFWSISADGVDLLRKLLTKAPMQRCSAQQALEHCWIEKRAPKASDRALPPAVLEGIRSFSKTSALKKIALSKLASGCDVQNLTELHEAFIQLDGNQDGTVSMGELLKAFRGSGDARVSQVAKAIDFDGDGCVSYSEFLAATMDQHKLKRESVCRDVFRAFDLDGDGAISENEMQEVLEDPALQALLGGKAADQIIQECDRNRDGRIQFDEFMAALQ